MVKKVVVGDDDDDGDIDEGHDDVWYSIEQHLKGVHKSAEEPQEQ